MRAGDTIVALSSGAVPSGVAVIRLSGPAAGPLLESLTGRLPEPRRLTLSAISVAAEVIDRGLVAWFPSPQSFTGEDCAELQVHGSPAVVRGLLRHISSHQSVRLAEAGEFTRRAFENGRLDLTAVEGLGDLINAETETQRRQALARADGRLAAEITRWRNDLLDCRAEVEARLDFSDEGDVDLVVPPRVKDAAGRLARSMEAALAGLESGRIVREGLRVALAGPPNVGKSSLLNALARSDLAIVRDEPGSTRDVREVALALDGQLVVLVDMAGLRDATSKAEAEGVRRARQEIERADLVLWLVAPDVADDDAASMHAPVWRIATKFDLGEVIGGADVAISASSGDGISELTRRLSAVASEGVGAEPALLDRERDRAAVTAAIEGLASLEHHWEMLELAAEDLRRASQALARLTGEIDAEAVLDRLFSSFCIGK